MTLGMMLCAISIYYFLVPSKLIVGTLSGLAIVLNVIAAQFGIVIKVSTFILALNVFLLLIAYFLLGKETGIKTVYTALILGPMMDFLDKIMPYQTFLAPGSTSIMGDVWFDLLCFVITISLSQAILFSINTSTGGLDIVALIAKKYLKMNIGTAVGLSGMAICALALLINPVKLVIIGMIGTWINGLVVDYFTDMLNRRKRVCIISDEYEEVRHFIIHDLVRGCTLYEVKGGFSEEQHTEIQALLTTEEYKKVMDFIDKSHIRAFMTVVNVAEVRGFWMDRDSQKKVKRNQNR